MDLQASALSQLRAATRNVHDDFEKTLVITSPHAGRNEYLAYISALWGWLVPFEARLWHGPWPDEMQVSTRAQKCCWIESDLRAAEFHEDAINALPTSLFSPALTSMPERFGLAYVIEGAQLGTQVLRKALSPSLDPWMPRWMQGYGQETSQKWKVFIQCAEQVLDTPESRQVAACSAREGFDALAAWFKARGVA